jgi:hypothetical protein
LAALGLELNDAGLLAVAEDGALPAPPSPGLALFDGAGLEVGEVVAGRTRLKPRHVHSRFWDPLGTEALAAPFPVDATRADLAHAHLESFWKRVGRGIDVVLVAVPGFYGAEQLGLLLGIARTCHVPIHGLVDAAVASAVAVGRPGEGLVHVELQLHRAVATELRQGREVVRGRVESLEGAGVWELRETWARAIAASFVRRTRFDPLHDATSEQELHDRLPELLSALAKAPAAELALEASGREHTLELSRGELLAASLDHDDRIAALVGGLRRAGEPATLLLGQRLGALPGLAERLGDSPGSRVVLLEEGASARGALVERRRIESAEEALPFVTRLPSPVGGGAASALAAKVAAQGEPAAGGRRPTHLLHLGIARPILDEPLVIGTAVAEGKRALTLEGRPAGVSRSHCAVLRRGGVVVVEDWSSYGTFLNGQKVVSRAELEAGDVLAVGSPAVELLLLAVDES